TDTPYLLDGYGVLVFRIVIFKISSFKLQNVRLFLNAEELMIGVFRLRRYPDKDDIHREIVSRVHLSHKGRFPVYPVGGGNKSEVVLSLICYRCLGDLISVAAIPKLAWCIPPGQGPHQLKISLGSVFLLELSEVAMAAACAFRAEEMPSLISCWMAAKVMAGVSDVDVLLGGILSTKDDT
ncbi:hypothetical protein Tco_0760389, partial [Tanacetum coccineum]